MYCVNLSEDKMRGMLHGKMYKTERHSQCSGLQVHFHLSKPSSLTLNTTIMHSLPLFPPKSFYRCSKTHGWLPIVEWTFKSLITCSFLLSICLCSFVWWSRERLRMSIVHCNLPVNAKENEKWQWKGDVGSCVIWVHSHGQFVCAVSFRLKTLQNEFVGLIIFLGVAIVLRRDLQLNERKRKDGRNKEREKMGEIKKERRWEK